MLDVDVAVIIGTIDRAGLLYAALESLITQIVTGFTFEVVVVDNAASTATHALVTQFAAAAERPVRYIAEPRRGVSHARNTGVKATRAPIVAFMDDDQRAEPEWLQALHTAFRDPGISFVAGPVRPISLGGPLPRWVTRQTQGAVSIIDWGDRPRPIDHDHWMCLPGGNMAIRRATLEAVGGWRPYPRSQDRELTVRLLLSGYRGVYLPQMCMKHYIEGERLTRAFVRRWNTMEGRMRAGYCFEELFDATGRIREPQTSGRRIGGVPLYLYRQLLTEVGRWAHAAMCLRRDRAFGHEARVRYLASYIRARLYARRPAAEPNVATGQGPLRRAASGHQVRARCAAAGCGEDAREAGAVRPDASAGG